MSEIMLPERISDDVMRSCNEAPVARPATKRGVGDAADRVVRVPFRTTLNYLVDAVLAILFLALIWLATIERFVFPSGPEGYRYKLWGANIDDWRRYQFAALCGLSFLVVVHVTLHWNWVCSVTNTLIRKRPAGKDNGARTLIGVGLLLIFLHALGATVLWGKFQLKSL